MKKKIIISLIVIALILAVGIFFFLSKKEKKEKKFPEKEVSLRILDKIEPVELSAKIEPDLVLTGQTDKTTDPFLLKEKEAIVYDLSLILNSLKQIQGDPFYEILIYRVGQEEPVGGDNNFLSLAGLKESGWKPEESEKIGEPRGQILGVTNLIEGPGQFYFLIDIENIDQWILKLRKVKSPF